MKIRLAALITVCAAALLWYTEPLKSGGLASVCMGSKESRTDVIQACTGLIESESTSPKDRQSYLTRRAWVYYCDKQYDKAIVDADQVLSSHHENTDLLMKRATFKQANGDLEGASVDFERAREIAPDSPCVHFSLGKFHEMQGKSPLAAASYQRVLEIDPDHQDAFKKIVNYRYTQKDYASVRELLADARARWPESEWVYKDSINSFLLFDVDLPAALSVAKAYTHEFPNSVEPLFYLSIFHFALGDDEGGISSVHSFAKHKAKYEEAKLSFRDRWFRRISNWVVTGHDQQWVIRAVFYAALGQKELALQEFQDFLDNTGTNGRTLVLRLVRGQGIAVDNLADAGSEEHLNQAISDYVDHMFDRSGLDVYPGVAQLFDN